jgi:M6 family metalloprotease-like protein
MRRRVAVVATAAVLATVGTAFFPGPSVGQDIELAAQAAGRTLPPAYFDRIREQPDFFQIKDGWIARTARAVESGQALTGNLSVAVVLALFSDSPEPHVTSAEVQAALFDGPTPFGTVTEFYDEASGGRLRVTGQAFPWVRTSLTMAEVVGDSWGLGEGSQTGTFLLEAVAAVDASVDFGQFDNDGPDGIPNSGDDDGKVDAVAIQFLEVAASCGGPSIWPHRSRLRYRNDDSPFVTDDPGANGWPILLDDYTTQGATDCGGELVQKATTIAHELGHVIGLPDLYDRSQGLTPEERRWVVGCWSLMAAGAWGCGTMNREAWVRPTHFGAWEKERLGWLAGLEEVEPGINQVFSLGPVQETEQVLRIPLETGVPADSAEYLLVEYRTREGFDADLPAAGVLVYKVSPRVRSNQPCDTCPQVYRVGLLEADGNNSLRLNFLQGGNRGEAGDAWGASGPGQLTPSSYPSTRLNSGARTDVTIYEISLDGGRAQVTLSTSVVATASLLQSLLGSSATPLTAQERDYLDSLGNGNGQYDVGDLRAYMKR